MAEKALSNPAAQRIGFVDILGDGAMAGLYGASGVAMWLLAVDSWLREPFWVPSLVGGALLYGIPPSEARVDHFLTAAFSVIHGLAFIAFGVVCAYVTARLPRTPDFPLIALGCFLPLQLGFVAVARLLMPDVAEAIGHAYIVVGNVLAALLMAFYLRRGQPHPEDFAGGRS